MTDLENRLGMQNLHGKIKVSASLWEKNGEEPFTVEVESTVRSFRKAEKVQKRVSVGTTIETARKDRTKSKVPTLSALIYRTDVSEKKGYALYEKGACSMGVIGV